METMSRKPPLRELRFRNKIFQYLPFFLLIDGFLFGPCCRREPRSMAAWWFTAWQMSRWASVLPHNRYCAERATFPFIDVLLFIDCEYHHDVRPSIAEIWSRRRMWFSIRATSASTCEWRTDSSEKAHHRDSRDSVSFVSNHIELL